MASNLRSQSNAQSNIPPWHCYRGRIIEAVARQQGHRLGPVSIHFIWMVVRDGLKQDGLPFSEHTFNKELEKAREDGLLVEIRNSYLLVDRANRAYDPRTETERCKKEQLSPREFEVQMKGYMGLFELYLTPIYNEWGSWY